jgi:hypothetical protein
MGRRLREHRRKSGSATLSVTDKMPVERRGEKGQPWVLLFDWLFAFEQFAKRNEALLKPDLLARGGFSANCRRRCSRSLIRPGGGKPTCRQQRPDGAPVRCVERQPSGRRRKLPGKPTGCLGFERVRRNDADLNVIAFRAFEQPLFETGWSRRNAFQHHPRLAA